MLSKQQANRGLGSDFCFSPLSQRAIQQAVGSSLQGDLPNDKGMRSTGPLRLLPFLWAFIFIFSEVS